ncbi:MAG: aminopeptidase P family protein [Pseudomonadota bacterium]
MRQTFDIRGGPQLGRRNLPKLRMCLGEMGLDYFYIPHEDEYQNEYLPDANERLSWATGFTGSAGAAIIGQSTAIVFVDGRYTLQAADQLDPDLFETAGLPDPGPFGWLSAQDLSGKSIGYDPRLMSPNDLDVLKKSSNAAGATVVRVDKNPVDLAWVDRPAEPLSPVIPYPIEFAGVSSEDKRNQIAVTLSAQNADAAIITSPSSIAWLFNIRGGDVMCTPLPLGRAIIHANGSADLFIDPRKVTDDLRQHLGNGVSLHDLPSLEAALSKLEGKAVSLDPATASAWFFEQLENAGADILRAQDPSAIPKACKNSVEIKNTQHAHLRDGTALTRFLHWLATTAQTGEVTEIDAAIKLETLRHETGQLNDLSFETISGAGPNGAVVHYRVSTATNRKLDRGSLFLVDSGAQYLDGTTDVTRTVPIGDASKEMAERYTLVLKGHIALSTVRFPAGTTGTHLDILARHALWQAGLDYEHGTGHGVGVYLGVHEGPQRIAKPWNATPLQPGMIVSNEPGYYKTGEYGIRIENLQFVTEAEAISGGEIPMLGFQNITFAPLDHTLMRTDLLTQAELDWINNYHREVWDNIGPRLDGDEKDWLETVCAPL